MELLEHYRQLASYDRWANLEVIDGIRAGATPVARPKKLMAHIVAAEQLWLARLERRQAPLPVWPELTLDQCEEQVAELAGSWEKYLAAEPDLLETKVPYTNSKGEFYESLVRDILTHVFMHSAYHRGQIASDMREAGNVPAYTDFIHGVRQGLVE